MNANALNLCNVIWTQIVIPFGAGVIWRFSTPHPDAPHWLNCPLNSSVRFLTTAYLRSSTFPNLGLNFNPPLSQGGNVRYKQEEQAHERKRGAELWHYLFWGQEDYGQTTNEGQETQEVYHSEEEVNGHSHRGVISPAECLNLAVLLYPPSIRAEADGVKLLLSTKTHQQPVIHKTAEKRNMADP